ncbi:MAG: glycosyltransferase family 2 protein [Bacteroidia bacterium]|nr:glycosyltransferase family 2 protein [Bacteroidia bacterium]
MIYILYILVGFAAVQFVVALSNLLFQEKLSEKGLPQTGMERNDVSVLIPVRNEEKNIGSLLSDLLQAGDNFREIIVFDDESTDRTAEVILTVASADSRVRLLTSAGLPEGWLGKNHACHRLALEARGQFLLFLDADVRISKELIDKMVNYVKKKKLDLLSIFPTQDMITLQEKITVPNMHYILLSLLPLPLVRLAPFSSLAAANGQCMLFRSEIYRKYMLHEKFRKSRAEDIEIARYLKTQKRKVSCITGVAEIQCRMYHNLGEAVSGFAKNVTFFFGNSYVLATLFWLVTTLGILPVLITGSTKILTTYLLLVVLTRVFVSLAARQSVLQNLLLLIPQQWMLGAFIYQSAVNKTKKQFRWKERTI